MSNISLFIRDPSVNTIPLRKSYSLNSLNPIYPPPLNLQRHLTGSSEFFNLDLLSVSKVSISPKTNLSNYDVPISHPSQSPNANLATYRARQNHFPSSDDNYVRLAYFQRYSPQVFPSTNLPFRTTATCRPDCTPCAICDLQMQRVINSCPRRVCPFRVQSALPPIPRPEVPPFHIRIYRSGIAFLKNLSCF